MKTPFDSKKYFDLQSEAIKDRFSVFPGKLYFEIGGKFTNDEHAARVLPGFDPQVKVKILNKLTVNIEIIFCISSIDIEQRRVWTSSETYEETVLNKLKKINKLGFEKPLIVINFYKNSKRTTNFEKVLRDKDYRIYKRYIIEGYPENLSLIASEKGFGKDDYIETKARFVIVIGAGSNSGKMSTCLGQVYCDTKKGLDSGYAKYETFPIWNLDINHPVNLAYEAATADIHDYNVYDPFYKQAYGKNAVNYNRDIQAFPIIKDLLYKFISDKNYMRSYKSPTDMGISNAGFCFRDDLEIRKAAIKEIRNRILEYTKLVRKGKGKQEWVERCKELLLKASK